MNNPIYEIALDDLAASVGSLAKANALMRAQLQIAQEKISKLESDNKKDEDIKNGN